MLLAFTVPKSNLFKFREEKLRFFGRGFSLDILQSFQIQWIAFSSRIGCLMNAWKRLTTATSIFQQEKKNHSCFLPVKFREEGSRKMGNRSSVMLRDEEIAEIQEETGCECFCAEFFKRFSVRGNWTMFSTYSSLGEPDRKALQPLHEPWQGRHGDAVPRGLPAHSRVGNQPCWREDRQRFLQGELFRSSCGVFFGLWVQRMAKIAIVIGNFCFFG